MHHVNQAASGGGPGGTNLSCGHHTWDSAWQHAHGSGPQESLSAPNRIATG